MYPSVSVVIPVYNDPDGIKKTLGSIVKQDYCNYTICPVDNKSTDNTDKVIKSFKSQHPEEITPVVERDQQSSYAARNTGINASNNPDLYLFLDADMWVPENWIRDMIATLTSSNCDYLGCNVELVTDDRLNFW